MLFAPSKCTSCIPWQVYREKYNIATLCNLCTPKRTYLPSRFACSIEWLSLSLQRINLFHRSVTKTYYTHFKLSVAQINSKVVTVKHDIQVAILRQVPSTTYAAAGSGKVNFSFFYFYCFTVHFCSLKLFKLLIL